MFVESVVESENSIWVEFVEFFSKNTERAPHLLRKYIFFLLNQSLPNLSLQTLQTLLKNHPVESQLSTITLYYTLYNTLYNMSLFHKLSYWGFDKCLMNVRLTTLMIYPQG